MPKTANKTSTVSKRKATISKEADVKEVYEVDGGKVMVRILFRDGDVIEMTANELADDVRQQRIYRESIAKVQKSLDTQFIALSKLVENWRRSNSENLLRCVIAYSDTQCQNCSVVYFFAVQNSNEYNEKFSRSLTQLELDVENSEQFNMVNMKVLELPKMDLEQVKEFVNNYISST